MGSNGLTSIIGRVGIEAQNDIALTETSGALNVLIAQSLAGNVRLSVREHAGQGDNLNLILPNKAPALSDTIHPTQNGWAILIDYLGVANVKRDIVVSNPASDGTIDSPSVNAENGWILLRVGDNVTLGGLSTTNYPDANLSSASNALTDAERIAQNTKVVAGAWIDIHGDYSIYTPLPDGGGQGDTGHGTVMHLHGTITPGALTSACRDEINPGRDCNITRIFGNVDTDTINFDQTFLGGRTHVYGSVAMTCTAHTELGCTQPIPTTGGPVTAPAGDSEDFTFVNELQTMNVGAGHALTLDLQDGTDTYVVNTTGSQPCLGTDQISGGTCHNYVINVLDTGAPNRGSDVLIVNGIDTQCSGYDPADCDRQHAVPDRRHLPAPAIELHRVVSRRDTVPGERDRGQPGIRRAAPRQLRHGHAGGGDDGYRSQAVLRRQRGLHGRPEPDRERPGVHRGQRVRRRAPHPPWQCHGRQCGRVRRRLHDPER